MEPEVREDHRLQPSPVASIRRVLLATMTPPGLTLGGVVPSETRFPSAVAFSAEAGSIGGPYPATSLARILCHPERCGIVRSENREVAQRHGAERAKPLADSQAI